MKKLLNSLYVLSEDAYLTLDGENVSVTTESGTKNFPLHTLEAIVSFSYKGASPALMGKCARDGVALSFFSPNGRFLASCGWEENGNVLLRREQYRIADSKERSLPIASSFLAGKLYKPEESGNGSLSAEREIIDIIPRRYPVIELMRALYCQVVYDVVLVLKEILSDFICPVLIIML